MTNTIRGFIIIFSTMALTRGVDYVTGNTVDRGGLLGDTLALPIVWGVACIILAALGVAASVRRCPRLGQWAGILGFAVNTMFAAQVFEWHMMPIPWPPEDLRFATDHLGHAAAWATIAVALWWRTGINRQIAAALIADGQANGR